MKLVFASDSFKGTLSAARINALLCDVASRVLPGAECVPLLLGDGGEGTLEAIKSMREGEDIPLYVYGGLRQRMRTSLFISGHEAFIEAATTCGLSLVDENDLDPLAATSNGVGAFISHAAFHGCNRIVVGLGGTCTNDGGMGCLHALGVRFFDAAGRELAGCGADLSRVASIDESGLYPQVKDASIVLMNDVANPLLGENGASHVFAWQKGADAKTVEELEAGMRNYAHVISQTHPEVDFNTPGYGAAGGLGMALSVFLGAEMTSGIEVMIGMVGFDRAIEGADLVVTGEGKLDSQSLNGKVVSGVVAHAKRAGVPVAALCGAVDLNADELAELGLAYVADASEGQSRESALANAEENYRQAAKRLFEEFNLRPEEGTGSR